jgi:hypothetical protein
LAGPQSSFELVAFQIWKAAQFPRMGFKIYLLRSKTAAFSIESMKKGSVPSRSHWRFAPSSGGQPSSQSFVFTRRRNLDTRNQPMNLKQLLGGKFSSFEWRMYRPMRSPLQTQSFEPSYSINTLCEWKLGRTHSVCTFWRVQICFETATRSKFLCSTSHFNVSVPTEKL